MAPILHKWFVAHPASVGETYAEHFAIARRFGLTMIGGGLAALVHALFPALFERTGSSAMKKLYSEMVARQPDTPRPAYEEQTWQLEYEI